MRFFLVVLLVAPALVQGQRVVRSKRGRPCKELDPSRDSIAHPGSHPDCRTRFADNLFDKDCICNYLVAESSPDGCPLSYYVHCQKSPSNNPIPLLASNEGSREAPKEAAETKEEKTPLFQPVLPEFESVGKLEPLSNTAPKLPDIGAGGQGVVSGDTEENKRPDLPPNVEFGVKLLPDLGERDLHQQGRPDQCPEEKSGCIFDDDVEGTDCTTSGSLACIAVGADYCSAAVGQPAKRVCCKTSKLRKATLIDGVNLGCPHSNQGCVFDDVPEGTDCTNTSSAKCKEVGAGYCGASVGSKRVCCSLGKPRPLLGDGTETCPDVNSGCIFDDTVHPKRSDCSEGGNAKCVSRGADYCSAWYGFPLTRVCCIVNRGEKRLFRAPAVTAIDAVQSCPANNFGCIFDDEFDDRVDCTNGGSAACLAAGLDYCSAFSGTPTRRVCCRAAGQ